MEVLIIIIIIILMLAYFWAKPIIRKRNRAKITKIPFPEAWETILNDKFTLYKIMPEKLKGLLKDKIKIFVNEKDFFGCEGLEVTDEMRVLIAAQASLLILNRKSNYFPKLHTVNLYPTAYYSNRTRIVNGIAVQDKNITLGESWNSGELVLAWDAALHGVVNMQDGKNVVYHEFAHQLDQEDGTADGAPILDTRSGYISWARILGAEYELLIKKKKRFKKSVMNKYGAVNPAEFFAVATETFFEKPQQLYKKHEDLYMELKNYYKLDPLTWIRK